jgi:hypothetical protein
VREKRVRLEDCYPVSRSQRVGKVLTTLSFVRDIWSSGKRASYKEALNSIPMVEGGRWVWQADKAQRPPIRGRPQGQRGRGAGFQRAPPPRSLAQGQVDLIAGQGSGAQGSQGNQGMKPPVQKQREPQHKQPNQGASMTEIDPKYRDLTCYNCGEPGHFIGICSRLKVCFICAVPGHYMTNCPLCKNKQPTASYLGSVGSGLGFYHVELPDAETTAWLNISNCGVVVVKSGNITIAELERELSEIFCKKWPWQIRELTPVKFLVKFPPHRRVADIKNLPSFNLRKAGV